MTLSKAARRVVVGITAVLTLLCQTTAFAHACAAGAAQSATLASHAPCHDTGGDSQGPAGDSHHAPCLSQAASTSPAMPDIPVLAGLPPLVVHTAALTGREIRLPVSEPPPLRGEPPPLSILNCCLRN